MGTWYISSGEVNWFTLAELGIESADLVFRANGVDEFHFQVPGDLLATELLAFGAAIALKHDSTIRFRGRINSIPRQGVGSQEFVSYSAVAGWWWLQQITYAQNWQVMRTTDNELVSSPKPRIIIGQDDAGNRRTLAAEIAAVVDYAIAAGAPIAKGTIDAGPTAPYSEHTNQTCADVIRQCMRFMPDRVCYFDHSTSPYPTFNCRPISSLPAATVDLAGVNAETLSLAPRYDLQVPGIRVVYEQTHTVDDYDYQCLTLDDAGTTADPRCVNLLFELAGSVSSYMKQKIEVADYPADPYTDKAFWVGMFGWLAGIADADLTIDAVTRSGSENYPHYLAKGSIQDWMSGVDFEDETWTVKVSYIRRNTGGDALESVESKDLKITLRSTNATTKEYRRLGAYVAAEAIPAGVAAALYASWGALQWDGNLSLTDADASFSVGPWNKLNISNGLAAWASMAAAVQQIEVDIAKGTSRIKTGPSALLEADALVALFRAVHTRRFAWSVPQRTSALSGGSENEGAYQLPREKPSEGDPGAFKQLRVAATVGEEGSEITHVIQIDPASIAFADSGDEAAQTIALREVLIPELDGSNVVLKRRQLLASASYHAGVPLSSMAMEWECSNSSGIIVSVVPADIPWGDVIIACAKDEETPPAPIPVALDFAAVPVGERRWVYAEINFKTRTCTAKLATANGVKAVNDPKNLISVRNLTQWQKDGASAISLVLPLGHKGEIFIGGESGPPLTA